MKIAIVGGKNKADFLISSLLKKNHSLMVINDDEDFCHYLAKTHKIPVFHGDPAKTYTLRDAKIEGYDVIIALAIYDSDNLAICQAAKRLLNIRKAVAIVSNPKSVDVFKKLGIDTAISATYMLANIIEQMSMVDVMMNSISVEHDRLMLTELLLEEHSPFENRKIGDLSLPERAIIGCVLRGSDMLRPQDSLELLANDKLLFLSPPSAQAAIIAAVQGGNL